MLAALVCNAGDCAGLGTIPIAPPAERAGRKMLGALVRSRWLTKDAPTDVHAPSNRLPDV